MPKIKLRSTFACVGGFANWLAAFASVVIAVSYSQASCAASAGDGSVIVRIDDPAGSHCIDASKEEVTVYLRRAFVEKKNGIFTEQKKAGVLVRTLLPSPDDNTAEVKVPSVDMVSIMEDGGGRVSLPLEYPVAAGLRLKQGSKWTQSMDIVISLAKTKGKNSFGQIIDIAGQVLGQSLLPSNPYTAGASKFLKFANQTIDASVTADDDEEIAHIGLKFNRGSEANLGKCETAGNERTGALAVLRSIGREKTSLIPVTDTEKQYCFSYSSRNTFEVTAARRKADGACPDAKEYSGVNNDYVMLLISAAPVPAEGIEAARSSKESRDRCSAYRLRKRACGTY